MLGDDLESTDGVSQGKRYGQPGNTGELDAPVPTGLGKSYLDTAASTGGTHRPVHRRSHTDPAGIGTFAKTQRNQHQSGVSTSTKGFGLVKMNKTYWPSEGLSWSNASKKQQQAQGDGRATSRPVVGKFQALAAGYHTATARTPLMSVDTPSSVVKAGVHPRYGKGVRVQPSTRHSGNVFQRTSPSSLCAEGSLPSTAAAKSEQSGYLFSSKRTGYSPTKPTPNEKSELTSRVSSFLSMIDTQAEFLKVPHKLKRVVGRLHVEGN